ncbi:MAG: PAS domain S-box protein [Ignavibacteriaceae bacterium]|nr:PAS domain S-box protein [Ignavibacteriaceae bacterium]
MAGSVKGSKKNNSRGLGVISTELTDLKRSEQKLGESEELLKVIFDNLEEGLITVEPEGGLIYRNPATLRIYGYDNVKNVENELEFLSRVDEMFETTTIDGKFLEKEQWPINRMMRGENFRDFPLYLHNKEQGWKKLILYNGKLIPDSNGKPLIGLLSFRDITRQMKTEDALLENEERFRTLADNILQLTWMTDESGYIFWYNKRWYDYTGTTFEEMQGWGWEKVHHPDHIDRVMKIWTGALKEGKPWEDIFPLRSKNGEYGWFLSRAMPIRDDNGKILRWFGTNTDITERMKYEDALKEAYENIEERFKEKEVLLRELYHRTKNNMQVVSSLLGLKGERVVENETKEILVDIGNRIQAIALVHEKLYQSKNLSRIDMKEYITDLANLFLESYNSTERHVKLKLDLESISVLIDTAIPCGQIIAELISNSLKHAFPFKNDGEIFIHLSRNRDNLIKLIISDNGVGISDYTEETGKDTLGMKLFRNLAEDQLRGDISFNMKKGVSWTVRFKDVLYDERV